MTVDMNNDPGEPARTKSSLLSVYLTDRLEERSIASNPLFIIPDFFFCIFPMNFAMATLGLKEMGKFLWEGREKVCPVG